MSVLHEKIRPEVVAGMPAPVGPGIRARGYLGAVMFASRWLQAPLYLGLIVAQMLYVVTFMQELWHLATHITTLNEAEMMLMVLGLVDVVMVANLIIMVIIGGYETFVSRLSVDGHPDQPEWLSQVNANILKVKLAMAIIGISSVHLLKSFVEARTYFEDPELGVHAGDVLLWQTVIHIAFIASAMALAWIDKLSIASHEAAEARHA
ncbi:TIGR00645 family protein [Arthrobacter sp.]|uniref:TIGR00645 family protein n=1 Tax=Arthrobacter sp. TaxID=1667 RepID=UPI0028A0C24E|nr:TIGR00645 family protein [Arthrobacter sp.]